MNGKLPAWFRQDIPDNKALTMSLLLSEFAVNTVCKQAKCPNSTHCFDEGHVTFMILGNTCTRNCKFCAVAKSNGEKLSLDADESYRISRAVKSLSLSYAVITSVTRDDLLDGGAGVFAKTIGLIRSVNKEIRIEALIPDFQGKISSLQRVLEGGPCVLAHNIETVERLYEEVRPLSQYRLSLRLLSQAKELKPGIVTKSSIMLGLGEDRQEVMNTLEDLKDSNCDIVTLGQYLAPSQNHYPVQEFIGIEQFREYQVMALDMGFKAVLSGPLVRSSYRAEGAFNRSQSTL